MSPSSHSPRKQFPLLKIGPRETGYPQSLIAAGIAAPIQLIGEPKLLRSHAMALFCSVKCPGSIIMKTYEAMQKMKLRDSTIAGGFHSPMERTCLDILIRGRARLILCPARGIRRLRLRPEWREPLSENRILIASPFDKDVRRSTIHLASSRNMFVAALADTLLIPYAARQSHTEQFAIEMLNAGKIVYTIPDADSQPLIDLGARPFPL